MGHLFYVYLYNLFIDLLEYAVEWTSAEDCSLYSLGLFAFPFARWTLNIHKTQLIGVLYIKAQNTNNSQMI